MLKFFARLCTTIILFPCLTSIAFAEWSEADVVEQKPRTSSLENRIQRLEDIEEIRTLRYTYHHYINTGRFSDIPNLYTDDAYVELGEFTQVVGKDQIQAAFDKMPGNTTFIRQFPHNMIIDVDGDTAESITYFEARYASADGSLMVAGQYFEEYARTEGVWLISMMVMKLDFAVPPDVGWAGPKMNFMQPPDSSDD